MILLLCKSVCNDRFSSANPMQLSVEWKRVCSKIQTQTLLAFELVITTMRDSIIKEKVSSLKAFKISNFPSKCSAAYTMRRSLFFTFGYKKLAYDSLPDFDRQDS